MSDVAIACYVLAESSSVTARVPIDRIIGGDLPLEIGLPAIGIKTVTINYDDYLADAPERRARARTRVTVHGRTLTDVKEILLLCRQALGRSIVTVPGFTMVAIAVGPTGPDMTIPGPKIRYQSQDFMIGFNEPTRSE